MNYVNEDEPVTIYPGAHHTQTNPPRAIDPFLRRLWLEHTRSFLRCETLGHLQFWTALWSDCFGCWVSWKFEQTLV